MHPDSPVAHCSTMTPNKRRRDEPYNYRLSSSGDEDEEPRTERKESRKNHLPYTNPVPHTIKKNPIQVHPHYSQI